MLVAGWDLRRLAVADGLPHPFLCPTVAGFVVDETSEAGVISRGWNAPAGWVIKGPSWCLAVTNLRTGAFMAHLTRTRPRACHAVLSGLSENMNRVRVGFTTRSIVNSNMNPLSWWQTAAYSLRLEGMSRSMEGRN